MSAARPSSGSLRDCPACGQRTPDGNFCVRCGAPLSGETRTARGRSEFAAAPGEHRLAPRVVSTLFPHLPRASMLHFRIALTAGVALVATLSATRIFGVALISAALLMPLLTVIYFYDVDVYQAEPRWAIGATVVWGAVSGVGLGLIAKALAPTGAALIDRGSTAHVLVGGILLPLLGVLFALCGPLVLLLRRRYHEMLDGVTFGAATAVTVAAAAAIVVGAGVLASGLRPPGPAAPWVLRLLTTAVATPVLSMAAVGFATGAIWVRYAARAKHPDALGVLGAPPVAVVLAALLVVAGAVGETFLSAGGWLGLVVALDLIELLLLRRAVHIGLLEESADTEIGPPLRCANCGALTAAHTFCATCGIALRALPKTREGARGSYSGRLGGDPRGTRRLVGYAVATAVLAGIAVAVIAAAAPAKREPPCRPHVPCGVPPRIAQIRLTFPDYQAWESDELGYSLRYDKEIWAVKADSPSWVELESPLPGVAVRVEGAPESHLTPAQLLNARRVWIQEHSFAVETDTAPQDVLLGPNVGLRAGVGEVLNGTVNTALGVEKLYSVVIMAAGDGKLSVAVTAIVPANEEPLKREALDGSLDDIFASIEWPSS